MQAVRAKPPAQPAAGRGPTAKAQPPAVQLQPVHDAISFVEHPEPSVADLRLSRGQVQNLSLIGTESYRFMNDSAVRRREVLNGRMHRLRAHIVANHVDEKTQQATALPLFGAGDRGSALDTVAQDTQRWLVRVKGPIDEDRTRVSVDGCIGMGGAVLNFSKIQDPSLVLYPGQVLGVEGRKVLEGEDIEVERVHSAAPLPLAKEPAASSEAKRQRVQDQAAQSGGPAAVVFASGPFGPTGAQACKVLQGLVHAAEQRGAAALVVVGPLFEEHGAEGRAYHADVDEIARFEDWFGNHLRTQAAAAPHVCFVPSTADVFHDFVFPQPMYDVQLDPERPDGTPYGRVHMLPNPAVIRVGGVSIGVCSADVLRHFKNVMRGKVMDKPSLDAPAPAPVPFRAPAWCKSAATELVRSHSFYPLVPAPAECPLDYSKSHLLAFPGGVTPNVLVLPSQFNAFSEHIRLGGDERCVVLNPGRYGRQGADCVELRIGQGDQPVWRRSTAQWWRISGATAMEP
eukprot:TRINITY_DN10866_c0_g1_i1.p1 TRINITY_DN10866_c0_g1~~TRINITY_DN10866_c0_g1_i1.p1  ORF type:complete len:513 (+),score=163.83 TRINITY_DN10866_c0_g1_i1:89-1627(+)